MLCITLLFVLKFFSVLFHTGMRERERQSSMCSLFEPHHDKTNKMTVRLAKTQISLGIRPV